MAFFPIPSMLLRQLYTFNSLKNVENGVQFAIKNRLTDVTFSDINSIKINGLEVPPDKLTLDLGDGNTLNAADVSENYPIDFPLRKIVLINAEIGNLANGKHKIQLETKAKFELNEFEDSPKLNLLIIDNEGSFI